MRFTHSPFILLAVALFSLASSVLAISPTTITTTSPSPQTFLLPPTQTSTTATATSPSPSNPKITTPPSLENIALNFRQKWHIETYSTCVTWKNGYTHCGIHKPVRVGGSEIAGAGRVGGGSSGGLRRTGWGIGGVLGVVVLGAVV